MPLSTNTNKGLTRRIAYFDLIPFVGRSPPRTFAAAEEDVKVGFLEPSKVRSQEKVSDLGNWSSNSSVPAAAAAANVDISDEAETIRA